MKKFWKTMSVILTAVGLIPFVVLACAAVCGIVISAVFLFPGWACFKLSQEKSIDGKMILDFKKEFPWWELEEGYIEEDEDVTS
jgi:hypothetical protein